MKKKLVLCHDMMFCLYGYVSSVGGVKYPYVKLFITYDWFFISFVFYKITNIFYY